MSDIRQKLFSIFEVEHAQHVEQIRSILALLSTASEAQAKAMLDEAFRRAHTLKGAARAVDLKAVEELASGLESLLARVREGGLQLDREVTQLIHQSLESSEECLAAAQQQRVPTADAGVLEVMARILKTRAAPESAPAVVSAPTLRGRPASAGLSLTSEAPIPLPEMVRLPSENLDRLVRSTGQLLTEGPRQALITSKLAAIGGRIAKMEAACDSLRQASAGPFQRLAADSGFAPVVRAIETVEQEVGAVAGEVRAVRAMQQRSGWNTSGALRKLQQDVWSARMTPASGVFEGFRKMVRDLAREENKELDFEVTGADTRADRVVLQALRDPVMHLLRNSISHGIELPLARERKGKPAIGRLTLRIACDRERLLIEVDDDGSGVDFKAVAHVAEARGIETESPQELSRVIFRPGFTTSSTVNSLSGRGMGLSVVHETVRRLQGEVNLRPKPDPGASIVLSVPLSVSSCHLLLVRAGGQSFGIPSHGIARLWRVKPDQLATVEGKPVVQLAGRQMSLFRLSQLLGLETDATTERPAILKVAVLRSASRHEAVLVDEFAGDKDVLIQDLGFPNPPSGNVAGGALTGDGGVIVVLNPAGLIDNCTRSNTAPLESVQAVAKGPAARILVVDDSITARSLERSILETNGYRVQVAVDGQEGLEIARAEKPDLIVTDLQMPRLDGFGLLEALKADPELRQIPVIIVSSVETAGDQERGLVLGADAYVVKRKFDEQELLNTIRQIL